MKTCFKCLQDKPLSEFYKHNQMHDGHLNKCKECTKSDVGNHRLQNIDRIRAYDVSRARKPHRVASRIRITREYKLKYPERYEAMSALGNAVRSGKIIKQPCFICGNRIVEGHHPIYSMPLDVVWLCKVHHREIHLSDTAWKDYWYA